MFLHDGSDVIGFFPLILLRYASVGPENKVYSFSKFESTPLLRDFSLHRHTHVNGPLFYFPALWAVWICRALCDYRIWALGYRWRVPTMGRAPRFVSHSWQSKSQRFFWKPIGQNREMIAVSNWIASGE
jgi:hypothetical protein